MRRLRQEMKNTWCRRFGLIVLLFMMAFTLFSSLRDKPQNKQMEESKQGYLTLLESYGGPLDPSKEEQIITLYNQMIRKQDDLDRLSFNYHNGTVSYEDYQVQSSILEEVLADKDAVHALYQRMIYTREDTQHRRVMYTNGWEGLFALKAHHLLLPFFLLLLTLPIFTQESDSDMWELVLTSKGGARRALWIKWVHVILVILIVVVTVSIAELAVASNRFGLPDGASHLSNIPTYAVTSYTSSLWSTYLFMVMLRMLGLICYVVICITVFIRSNRYDTTFTTGLGLIVLPLVLSFTHRVGYLIGPFGLIQGRVWWGEPQLDLQLTQEARFELAIHSPSLLIILLLITLLITAFLISLTSLRIKRGERLRLGHWAIWLLPFIVLNMLTGCHPSANSAPAINLRMGMQSYSINGHRVEITTDNLLLVQYSNGEERKYPNIENGEIYQFYTNGSYIFYTYTQDDTRLLARLSLDLAKEEIIYRQSELTDSYRLLRHPGMTSRVDFDELLPFDSMVEVNGWIHIIDPFTQQWKMLSPISRQLSVLAEHIGPGNVAIDHDTAFYITEKNRLQAVQIPSGNNVAVPPIQTQDWIVGDDAIYYSDLTNHGMLTMWEKGTHRHKVLFDQAVQYLDIDNEFLIFASPHDSTLSIYALKLSNHSIKYLARADDYSLNYNQGTLRIYLDNTSRVIPIEQSFYP